MGPLDTEKEAEGVAIETLFLQHLRAINDYLGLDYSFYFWRTITGLEVDFVAYGPNGFCAFEMKRSSTITNKSLKGLRAFKEEYPEAKLYILYLGKQKEYYGDVTAIPLEEALRGLPEILKMDFQHL